MKNLNYKIKFCFIIVIIIISFSLFLYSEDQVTILNKERDSYQKAYKKNHNYYLIEYFFNEKLEYIISKYYIEQFLLPVFLKKGFKEIDITRVEKPPQIKMENKMPKSINFTVFKELYYTIIKEGSYNYNYQILVVFSKKFGNYYLIRLFEFKLYYKERNKSTFISGGVYIKVTDKEFKIIKEF